MGKTIRSTEVPQQPPRSPLAFGYKTVAAGIIAAGLLLGAAAAITPSDLPDRLAAQFWIDFSSLLACFIFAVFAGIPLAGLLLNPVLLRLSAYHGKVETLLGGYGRSTKWPGRRFFELLRSSSLATLRRDFLAFGLDTFFRIPDARDIARINRLSTLLFGLEQEARFRGRYDLLATAHNVRGLLLTLSLLRRIKLVFIWLFYLALPGSLALGLALLLSSRSITWLTWYPVSAAPQLPSAVVACVYFLSIPLSIYAVGQTLFLLTWTIAQRTRTELDDIAVQLLSWIFAGASGIGLLLAALKNLSESPESLLRGLRTALIPLAPFKYEAGEVAATTFLGSLDNTSFFLLRVAVILWATSAAILLLRSICLRVLKQFAARTRQKHDDVMVELLRIFGTFILGAMGFGWIVMVFAADFGQDVLSSRGGAESLMPYAILVAVSGAILGIASRDMLENFFAGISLQIDKTFESGERVVLENGAVCEVRSIGMRSSHFFNIVDNTDLYVPNSRLAVQSVTNLSRPDREYRRVLTIHVRDESDSLMRAEHLLLLAAFTLEGVDVPTILGADEDAGMFHKSRPGIVAEFRRLQDQHEECANATIRFRGSATPISEVVSEICTRLDRSLQGLTRSREERWRNNLGFPNEKINDRANTQLKDLLVHQGRVAHDISFGFYELATCFYTLGAEYPSIRLDLEHLVLELLRAPSVESTHHITEDGASLWSVKLRVYAQLTEQSDEILHYLNVLIQQLLGLFDLLPPTKIATNLSSSHSEILPCSGKDESSS